MLMVFREKLISLDHLHAVNFIVSCRVMASIMKKPGRPKRHTFVYAKKALASILLPKSLCLVMQSHTLVLKARLEVLLASWQYLVFLLALESRQLRDCLVDDLKGGLDLFLGNDERGRQTDDVLVGRLGL
jgi:hypothetical protein